MHPKSAESGIFHYKINEKSRKPLIFEGGGILNPVSWVERQWVLTVAARIGSRGRFSMPLFLALFSENGKAPCVNIGIHGKEFRYETCREKPNQGASLRGVCHNDRLVLGNNK